jgi:hypothetical protein
VHSSLEIPKSKKVDCLICKLHPKSFFKFILSGINLFSMEMMQVLPCPGLHRALPHSSEYCKISLPLCVLPRVALMVKGASQYLWVPMQDSSQLPPDITPHSQRQVGGSIH